MKPRERTLRLVTVGTGTGVPRSDRKGPCTLLQIGGYTCVVDLGLGALHGLLAAGVGHQEVDALLFTHHHPDHVAEWVPFLFAANYDETPRSRPLQVVAHPETLAFLDRVEGCSGKWLTPQHYRRAKHPVRGGDRLELGPLRVETLATPHTDSSLAYRLGAGERTIVITGDTGPDEGLEGFARNCDLLLIEASLASDSPEVPHLSVAQALEIGRRSGAARVLFYHLYPTADAWLTAGAGDGPENEGGSAARDGWELLLDLSRGRLGQEFGPDAT